MNKSHKKCALENLYFSKRKEVQATMSEKEYNVSQKKEKHFSQCRRSFEEIRYERSMQIIISLFLINLSLNYCKDTKLSNTLYTLKEKIKNAK